MAFALVTRDLLRVAVCLALCGVGVICLSFRSVNELCALPSIVCLLLYKAIVTVFQLYHGDDMM